MNKLIEKYFERGIALIEAVNKDDKAMAVACVANEIMSMEEAKLLWDSDKNRPVFDEQGFKKAYNGYKVLDLATAVAAQYKSIYYAGIQGINMEINCDLLQRYKDLGGTADEIKKLIVASEPEGGCLNSNHGSGKRELGFLIDTVQEDLANV